VSLEEGQEAPDVILHLEEVATFSGRVVDPAGRPVHGAQLAASFPAGAVGLVGPFELATTAWDGSFEVPLGPSPPPWVNVQAGSGSRPTVALRTSPSDEVEITIPDQGGILHLRWPLEGTDRRPPAHEIALVSDQGGVVFPATLPARPLSATEGDPEPGFEIGPLAPGSWRVLWARAQPGFVDALWAGGGGLPLVAVVTVFLGSVTTIER